MREVFNSFLEAKDFVDKNMENLKSHNGRVFAVINEKEGRFIALIAKNQPCWGGIRKYKIDKNPEGCTQDDPKPGDLYYKFPEGTPIYLIVSEQIYFDENIGEIFSFILGEKSPWRNGFVVGKTKFKTDNVKSYVKRVFIEFEDTDFDPTVTVNMLKFIYSKGKFILDFMETYNTSMENAVFLAYTVGKISTTTNNHFGFIPDTYSSTFILKPQKFFKGESTNLSGGTFKGKMDYNRKYMANIFKDPEGINICRYLSERFKTVQDLKKGLNSEIENLKAA